ncbi:MAG: hypothetical protein WC787_00160 [Patescibacteria group bacterium]|jgi:hypothetical protein
MTKNITISVIAIVAICVAVVGINYLSGTKAPRSGNVAPIEGSVSQAELDRATASLNTAVGLAGGASFDFQAQPTYGHYANFGIVKNVNEVKSVGLVDEMAIRFSGKTDNDNAEVDPKTGQVVFFHREADYTGDKKTQAQLEQTVRAFLTAIYPSFAQVESTLTFENNSKTGRPEGSNYFYTWNDLAYSNELPDGTEAERAPFIQVGITSSGFIFSYNNTVDLYRNALQEFRLTQ